MRSVEGLRKQFQYDRDRTAIAREMAINDTGLVAGAGTLFMRMRRGRFGRQELALTEDRDRALTLYCVAFRYRPSADFLHHLASAASHWPHDKALANLRLVFARLPKLADETAVWRLHLAAALLDEEFPPGRLLSKLGFAPFDFRKYDPDQPRVPAGNGRQSGEWGSTVGTARNSTAPHRAPKNSTNDVVAAHDNTTDQSGAATALNTAGTRVAQSFVDDISAEALAGLTEFASNIAAPTIFFGAMFIPAPNTGIKSEGTLPGSPDISYSADHDTGALELSIEDNEGRATTVRARLRDGVYVDVVTEAPLGRDLDGVLYIDRDAAIAALKTAKSQPGEDTDTAPAPKDDEPKLCPDETPDNPGATNSDEAVNYAQYVRQAIINPQRQPPLEPDMAFGLLNPTSGQIVIFDDCQDSTGKMIEIKGQYAWMLSNDNLRNKITAAFLDQADRQIIANDFRNVQTGLNWPVEWHFREKSVADFTWDLFRYNGFLPRIRVCYTPFRTGTSYCYPDPKR